MVLNMFKQKIAFKRNDKGQFVKAEVKRSYKVYLIAVGYVAGLISDFVSGVVSTFF